MKEREKPIESENSFKTKTKNVYNRLNTSLKRVEKYSEDGQRK